ncbi:MAG: SAM-dependent methyltransferase [Anaerolineae bacterium]|nr:SAM-dependent methyltransferase [Anaerolineae bacterium]
MNDTQQGFIMYPIGKVQRGDDGIRLEIDEAYRPALAQLDQFSHVMVFWWADRFDNDDYRGMLQCEPPYAQGHVTGMFATRSPIRPNLIAMTTCKLEAVDEAAGVVRISDIDAVDGTPIVDLKAYFPVCDRVKDAYIPAWLEGWPEWMPENGIGLEEGEA